MIKRIAYIMALLLATATLSAQQPESVGSVKSFSRFGETVQIIPKSQRTTREVTLNPTTIESHTACDHEHGVCTAVEYNNDLRKQYTGIISDGEFEAYLKQSQGLRQNSLKRNATGEKVYQIPVIVHVVYYVNGTDTIANLSKEAIYSQFDVLNEDFRRKVNTRGYNNNPVGADARIEFVKALYAPDGTLLEEPGIERLNAADITDGSSVLNLNSIYITTGTADWIKDITSWEPNCYLNIWTVAFAGGTLGFSKFPDIDLPGIAGYDLTPPPSIDGVCVDYRRLGTYERGPFEEIAQNSYGRTPTHEIGHFLGLRHTFGDAPTDTYGQRPEGCKYDDYVDDTPNTKAPMYDQFEPLYACGEREMIENYMDYSPEQIMNIFTQGQVERMHKVLENSPRRKQLTYSTVADANGEKTPVVTINASSKELFVLDVFTFDALVERFPGTYSWTFQDGTPATSNKRTVGVYFETPGSKEVVLTVSNAFGSVSKRMTINVKDVEGCTPQYSGTLGSVSPISMTGLAPGNYMTGHGNVYGYKLLANRFEKSKNAAMKAITQVEMNLNRFYISSDANYDPEASVKVLLMSEVLDSVTIDTREETVSNNYKVFKRGTTTPYLTYSFSKGERDTLVSSYRETPDMLDWYDDSNADLFKARKRRPGDTLAIQEVPVGEFQRAQAQTGKFNVRFDNPVVPTTNSYYIAIDLDYDYYATVRRPYSFEFKAGLTPMNFTWSYSIITIDNARINPRTSTYIFEWKPFDQPAYANSWGANVLLGMLPVYSTDTTVIDKPQIAFDRDSVAVGEAFVARIEPGTKPSNLTAVRWTVQKEGGALYTLKNSDEVSYTYSEPGVYRVTLTYEDNACLQRSASKSVCVKGIRLKITDSQNGTPIYCTTVSTLAQNTLTAVPVYKSGQTLSYKWFALPNETTAVGTSAAYIARPLATTTYRVVATDTDDATLTASAEFTVEVNLTPAIADFEVLTPHLRRGDTLDIYVTPDLQLEVKNKSQNVSQFKTSGIAYWDAKFVIEGIGDKAGMAAIATGNITTLDYKEYVSEIAKEGAGLYRLNVIAANRACLASGQAIARPAATNPRDTAKVYLNFLPESDFGPLEIKANGKAMQRATTPPAYTNSRGSYYVYVEQGENVVLEAVSNELESITWTNDYTKSAYTTRSVTVNNVGDITRFFVDVVRKRSNGQSTIYFPETVTVILYPSKHAPTDKSVAMFSISADSVCLGSIVKFGNQSTNAVDFKWEFSGGDPVADAKRFDITNEWSPSRKYNVGGDYTVKLTTTSADGSTSTHQRTIHVAPANNPRMMYGFTDAMRYNDTLYSYATSMGSAFTIHVSGYGISKLESGTFETWLTSGGGRWNWTSMTSRIQGMDFYRIPHSISGYKPGELDGTRRFTIKAIACDKVTPIYDTLYFKMVPLFYSDDYSLEINGQPQQLGDKSLLPQQSICAGSSITFGVTIIKPDVKATSLVYWYEVDASGKEKALLGEGFSFTVTPTENTYYKMKVQSLGGISLSYIVPVQIGVTAANLRVMNEDLRLASDTVHIASDYESDLVLHIDNLVKPKWYKQGSASELSASNALVIVSPQDTVRYTVSALSPNGGCEYSVSFVVARQKAADTDDGDTEEPTDDTQAIEMYPIPAREVLNIESPYDGMAYIVSGNGQLIRQFNLLKGKTTLPLSGISAGVYRLVVQQAKGGKIISRNFVVVR